MYPHTRTCSLQRSTASINVIILNYCAIIIKELLTFMEVNTGLF